MTRVVVVTSHDNEDVHREARRLGTAAVFTKLFDPNTLVASLEVCGPAHRAPYSHAIESRPRAGCCRSVSSLLVIA